MSISLAPFQYSRSYIRPGDWASDQAIANLISPMSTQCPRRIQKQGVKDTRHIEPWANHGRTGHPLLHVGGITYHSVIYEHFFQSEYYTQIRSPAPISSTNGPIALCAVWSGWSCHRSCKLTIPLICPSDRTLMGVSAQASICILPFVNHGGIVGSITWSLVDTSYCECC